MPRLTGKNEVRRLKGALMASSGRDFEHLSLPLIRLIAPYALGCPALGDADRCGIDQLAWGEDADLELVVQLKGFKLAERELANSQVKQCLASITTFERSGLHAKRYLLVFNRFGPLTNFRPMIESALLTLKASGQVENAELWDLNRLMTETAKTVNGRLIDYIGSTVDVDTDKIIKAELTSVPLSESVCTVDRNRLKHVTNERFLLADPAQQIVDAGTGVDARVILLGEAGYGKTTAAMRAARSSAKRVFFVRAAAITKGGGNKNQLFEQFDFITRLTDDIPPEDLSIVEPLVRSAIESVLSIPNIPALLIIDGLDESVALSRRGGLHWLFNCVSALQVPVVLTARTEFWRSRQIDFATAIGTPSHNPGAPQRDTQLTLLELQPWNAAQILEMTRNFSATVSDVALQRVQEFVTLVESGKYDDLYGDIPRRPLFLRLILETIVSSGIHKTNRIDLIEEWVRAKIIRDYIEPVRVGPGRFSVLEEREAIDVTIELAFIAMRGAAFLMSWINNGQLELLTSCRVEDVIAGDEQLCRIVDPLGLFLNSLLLPVSVLFGTERFIRFGHQVYHEFFLAKYIERNQHKYADVVVPANVKQWYTIVD